LQRSESGLTSPQHWPVGEGLIVIKGIDDHCTEMKYQCHTNLRIL
jgi:hypothetical protein